MNYFVYISDSKVEMLYEQIPWSIREKFSFELSIDFGVVKARFSNTDSETARTTKLKLIEKSISRKIGTLFKPRSFFRGEMNMIWGPYHDYENFVYFGGTNENIHVGLGGTLTNCIGFPKKTTEEPTSYSLSSYLVSSLAKKKELPDLQKGFTSSYRVSELEERAISAVVAANSRSLLPRQKMKFLAKRVISGVASNQNNRPVLIGTPIYVACAD